MDEPQLGFGDYLRAAFNLKVPTPLMGGMPMNKLALTGFTIMGFAHPGFWLLGLGLEAAYLLWLSGNERFQALVRGERLALGQENWEMRERDMLLNLTDQARVRYGQLMKRCDAIIRTHEAEGVNVPGLGEIQQVRPVFLRLLNLQQRIQQMLYTTRRDDLEADIARLQSNIKNAPTDSPVARALDGTLKIQQARLENLNRSQLSLQYTNTELERIEKQLSLISEEMTVSRDPEAWSRSVDSVMQTIQGTTQWMTDHSELFESDVAPPTIITASAQSGRIAGKQ